MYGLASEFNFGISSPVLKIQMNLNYLTGGRYLKVINLEAGIPAGPLS